MRVIWVLASIHDEFANFVTFGFNDMPGEFIEHFGFGVTGTERHGVHGVDDLARMVGVGGRIVKLNLEIIHCARNWTNNINTPVGLIPNIGEELVPIVKCFWLWW